VQHEELGPISVGRAEAILESGPAEAISLTLIRLALHHDDWRWVQGKCLEFVEHGDVWVRRNSATALGHLARLHGELDVTPVLAALQKLKLDPQVASWAEAAIDDLTIFLRSAEPEA
jgi:hypothetical protein